MNDDQTETARSQLVEGEALPRQRSAGASGEGMRLGAGCQCGSQIKRNRQWSLTRSACAILALFMVPANLAAEVPSDGPSVGTVFAAGGTGTRLGNWVATSGGLLSPLAIGSGLKSEDRACCYTVFERGNEFWVVRISPIELTSRGGLKRGKIIDRFYIRANSDEIPIECWALSGTLPAITLVNRRTHFARSVLVSDSGTSMFNWVDYDNICAQDEP